MTKLIQRMREELVRRNYAETTIRSYLQTMEEFRRFADKRLDHLGTDDIRKFMLWKRRIYSHHQVFLGSNDSFRP